MLSQVDGWSNDLTKNAFHEGGKVMSNEKKTSGTPLDSDRRKFLNSAAMVGLAGAGLSAGLVSCKGKEGGSAGGGAGGTEHAGEYGKYEVPPGKLDDYYMFSSGGHSGDVRIYGLPSGSTLKQIPVFNMDCMVGWGITNESKAIIGTKPDGSVKYNTGDTHHVHGSYKDGTYDGKYLFVNDKIHGRMARIRLDTMETDKITEIPNIQGCHGIFPDKRDPVDQSITHTTRVFCGN